MTATSPGRSAIEVRNISKAYGTTAALSDVTLTGEAGRVLALLGPNGAGKTTLVRILTTLLRPDGGSATVVGFDVKTDAAMVRSMIGVTGQFAAIDLLLTGRENLEMIGKLCHLRPDRVRNRVGDLLDQLSLTDVADRLAKTYSGGMRRRLDLGASLISQPPVLVLDEPTTGLDPRTRADVWAAVEGLVSDGATVLLTTQYLEEADRLAHEIVLLDQGRIVAEGTPNDLKSRLGGDVLEVQLGRSSDVSAAVGSLPEGVEVRALSDEDRRLSLSAPEGVGTLRKVLDRLDGASLEVEDIGIRRPSLDDVFLTLTGHAAQSGDPPRAPSADSPGLPGSRADVVTAVPTSGSEAVRGDADRRAHAPAGPVAASSAVRDAVVITKRNLLRITRTPRLLAVSSIQPVLFVLMFRYVFGGSLRIPGESYIDYLLPGAFVTATLMGATTAVGMSTDLAGGMIERFRTLPIARSAVLAGRCTADLLRSSLVVAIVLVVGTILGFRFHNGTPEIVAAFALVLGAGFAFIWIYALIGLALKEPEPAQLASVLAMMPFVFASSTFVRVATMPGWLQVFARNQPVTVTVDAVRALCEGGSLTDPVTAAIAWIISLNVAGGALAVAMYRRL